jgi:quercetin dioxygenase-like cupin family protein
MTMVRVTGGPHAGRVATLNGGLVIGREGADLEIPDPELSRRHVSLRARNGHVVIEDLGSRNGTVVNDERIDGPVVIERDAIVRAGTSELAIELGAPVPPAPSTPAKRRVRGWAPWLAGLAGVVAAVAVAATAGSGTKTKTVIKTAAARPTVAPKAAGGPTVCPAAGVCLTTISSGVIQSVSDARTLLGGPHVGVSFSGPTVLTFRKQTFAPGAVFPWHTHPGSALVEVTQGTLTEYMQQGSGCVKGVHGPGFARWENGGDAHTLINNTRSTVVITVLSLDPVGNNQPVIPVSKPPNCPR